MNLLPQNIQRRLRRDYLFRFFGTLCVVICIGALIGAGTLLAPYLLIQGKMADLTAEIRNSAALFLVHKTTDLQKALIEANAMTKALLPVSSLHPTGTFQKIISAKPAGVRIISFSLEKNQKEASTRIQGIAASRNDILTFTQNLEKEKKFKDVSVPVSDFAKAENIEFSLSLIETQ